MAETTVKKAEVKEQTESDLLEQEIDISGNSGPRIGRGVFNCIEFLSSSGMLPKREEVEIRTQDTSGKTEFRFETWDNDGNVITDPKERYKELARRYHKHPPGKKKEEKLRRKREKKREEVDTLKSETILEKIKRLSGQAFAVLTSRKKEKI